MEKYHAITRIFNLEENELSENSVNEMIDSIQEKHPQAMFVDMKQSIMPGGMVGRDTVVITVVMKTCEQ